MPEHEKEAVLYDRLSRSRTRCRACARLCVAAEGEAGACGMRVNRGGKLMCPWGYVSSLAPDPVEKKPFFHALPGARTLSFGMLGCNYSCDFCQNWELSASPDLEGRVYSVSPAALAARAASERAQIMVSTYNEPVITAEWAASVFDEAKKLGLLTAFVSNGYATRQTIDFMKPRLDLWKVDLKSMDAGRFAKACGADLSLALDGLEMIAASGFWVEAVTLLVPGFNDSDEEIDRLAAHLAGLSRDIPWHVTAFHPAYRRSGTPAQTPAKLLAARETGRRHGLKYVYCGNLGDAGGAEDTLCPSCGKKLIERTGFTVISNSLGAGGKCSCGQRIPGIWKPPAIS